MIKGDCRYNAFGSFFCVSARAPCRLPFLDFATWGTLVIWEYSTTRVHPSSSGKLRPFGLMTTSVFKGVTMMAKAGRQSCLSHKESGTRPCGRLTSTITHGEIC